MRFIDKSGQRFGRLIAIRVSPIRTKSNHIQYECVCDCGNSKTIYQSSLKSGNTLSCGCLKKEQIKIKKTIHGLEKSKEYKTWSNLKNRCNNPNNKQYKDYGGRGILVCERWESSFSNFIKDMGLSPTKNHTLDRVENNGNYEPGNCKWSTRSEQSLNKRSSLIIEVNGITYNSEEFITELGISRNLFERLYYVKKLSFNKIYNKFKKQINE